jgi:predicted SprT family Zn-dependent metalloprotease
MIQFYGIRDRKIQREIKSLHGEFLKLVRNRELVWKFRNIKITLLPKIFKFGVEYVGMAHWKGNRIRLNYYWVKEPKNLRQMFGHEFAHLIAHACGQIKDPHGLLWRACMKELGLPARSVTSKRQLHLQVKRVKKLLG